MKTGYVCLTGVLVCLLYSCAPSPKLCILKPYWDRENLETLQRSDCIPVQTYKKWNRLFYRSSAEGHRLIFNFIILNIYFNKISNIGNKFCFRKIIS